MTNEQTQIVDAEKRLPVFETFLQHYNSYIETNNIKGKAAKQLLHCLAVYEYQRTNDPVFWITALRLDIAEISNFITKIKTQNGNK